MAWSFLAGETLPIVAAARVIGHHPRRVMRRLPEQSSIAACG
jgi:hypothetical protein